MSSIKTFVKPAQNNKQTLLATLTKLVAAATAGSATYADFIPTINAIAKAGLTTGPWLQQYIGDCDSFAAVSDYEKIWVRSVRHLGLNLETEKRNRLLASQPAKLSGYNKRKAEVAHGKGTGVSSDGLFWDALTIEQNFNLEHADGLSAERVAFWLQKHMRQTCWLAAIEVFRIESVSKESILATANSMDEHKSPFAVDSAEVKLMYAPMTRAANNYRKQLWKFVSYLGRGVTPKDLEFIIDIPKAIRREIDDAIMDMAAEIEKLFVTHLGTASTVADAAFKCICFCDNHKRMSSNLRKLIDSVELSDIRTIDEIHLACARFLGNDDGVAALSTKIEKSLKKDKYAAKFKKRKNA